MITFARIKIHVLQLRSTIQVYLKESILVFCIFLSAVSIIFGNNFFGLLYKFAKAFYLLGWGITEFNHRFNTDTIDK